MGTCRYCSGSGRDPITGAGTCSICGGTGQMFEPGQTTGGGLLPVGSPAAGDWGQALPGLLVVGLGYAFCGDVLSHTIFDVPLFLTGGAAWTSAILYAAFSVMMTWAVANYAGVFGGLAATAVLVWPLWIVYQTGAPFFRVVTNIYGPVIRDDILAAFILGLSALVHLKISLMAQPEWRPPIRRLLDPLVLMSLPRSGILAVLFAVLLFIWQSWPAAMAALPAR